jgi:UDPglucose 6-dehydrogenase
MRISVIGCGYLGATHAACLAELGHDVLGVETDPRQRALLASGELPFHEPGLDTLLATHVASGRLRFTDSLAEAAAHADLHFLCVGTPQRRDGRGADLAQVDGAVEELAVHLDRPAYVVGKSTVPVGTAARLARRVAELAPAGADAELVWNPEFLREGHAVEDTLRPDRVVIGVDTHRPEGEGLGGKVLRELYAPLEDAGVPVLVTDLPTAELVKVSANAFLATKVSFVNAVAEVCDAAGADVVALTEALGHDVRIGNRFLSPGIGFGGGCLPKDVRAFGHRAGELGVASIADLLGVVDDVNLRQRSRTVAAATAMLGGSVTRARIGVWGAAFKPGSDDVRDSPALAVASALQARGASVAVYDPAARETGRRMAPDLDHVGSALDAARGADLLLHLTEWPEFAAADPVAVGAAVRRPLLLDGRTTLDPAPWRAAGWTVRGLGRR